MRSFAFLVLIGTLAAGVLLWVSSDHDDEAPNGFDEPDLGLLGEDPTRPSTRTSGKDAGKNAAAVMEPAHGGLPRILPPEAAIEDVRDALAITKRSELVAALDMAYRSIGRIARQPRILVGLQRYARSVEDPRVRGVTYAALGANTSGSSRAWLAARLKDGPTIEDRIGALLGLAYDAKGSEGYAETLGGLLHKRGALPERIDAREGLRALLRMIEEGSITQNAPRDAAPIFAASLRLHPAWFAKERAAMKRVQQAAKD